MKVRFKAVVTAATVHEAGNCAGEETSATAGARATDIFDEGRDFYIKTGGGKDKDAMRRTVAGVKYEQVQQNREKLKKEPKNTDA